MKTFKQYINEKWYGIFKSPILHRMVDIFKNPSRKEIAEAQKKGEGEFRGFLMDNGDFYIISGAAFHEETRKEILHNDKNNIAMYGETAGSTIHVKISTSMKDRKDKRDFDEMKEDVMANKQLQRNFTKITVGKKYWG